MKYLLTLLILCISAPVFSWAALDSIYCVPKKDTLTKKEVFSEVDKDAEPTGGQIELFTELGKLKYRKKFAQAIQNDPEGKIVVAFVIDIDGSVIGKRVVRDIKGTDLSKQLLQIISKIKWTPALCGGKNVATIQTFPLIVHEKEINVN